MLRAILTFVDGISLPVLDINVRDTIYEHFQLIRFKDSQKIHGNDFIQSFPQITD